MSEKINSLYIYSASIAITLGGLLLGYDLGVMSGAIGYIEEFFGLSETLKGFAVSSAIIGSIIGVLSAGQLSDRLGRKKILLLSALFVIAGALICVTAQNFALLITGRIICGFGAAAGAMLPSMYISELAPAHMRGRLISLNQFSIVFGILAVYFVNSLLVNPNDAGWNTSTAWRWMFAADVVPGILLLSCLTFIPESPRWLTLHDKEDDALIILRRIGGEAYAQKEIEDIKQSCAQQVDDSSFVDLLKPNLRKALIVGLGLGILSQATGMNLVITYTPEILKISGVDTVKALGDTVLIGLTNFLATFIAFFCVDRFGRKPLLLIGSAGMAVALTLLGVAFGGGFKGGFWVLLCLIMYVTFFAIAIGPVVWVVIAEIFPTHVRGRGVSLAALGSWIAGFTIAQFFPMMLAKLQASVFYLYAAVCVFTLVFVAVIVPEMKGKSLEEIEQP